MDRGLLAATLEPERLRNARKLLALRAALTSAFLALSIVLAFAGGVPGARARLPILATYCAVSLALYANVSFLPDSAARSRWAHALDDWYGSRTDSPIVWRTCFSTRATDQSPIRRLDVTQTLADEN